MKFLNKDKFEVLKEVWGYDSFRENQEEAITAILKRDKDVLFIAKTGLGKSLVFQLPSLMLPGVTVVISPLLSLMSDQVSNADFKGISAATYNSTIGKKEKRIILHKLENNELDLLYIAPESILNAELLEFFKDKVEVNFVAIDEAHCTSAYGHDFRPKYKQIAVLREFISAPFVALTATADSKTVTDVKEILKLGTTSKYKLEEFSQNLDRPSIFYNVFPKIGNGYKQVISFINQHDKNDTGIVYCLTKASVDDLSKFLYRQGYKAKAYHAGVSNKDRDKVLTQWMNDEVNIIVATIAFGMGIDYPSVRYVVHLNIPTSLEGYVQEVGRASRDGLPSKAYLLYDPKDSSLIKWMLKKSISNPANLTLRLNKFSKMSKFATSDECYRKQILSYFNQKQNKDNCNSCSNCVGIKKV